MPQGKRATTRISLRESGPTFQSGPALVIDRAACTVDGLKILGLESRNKRRYREATLQKALPLYQGVQVYFDHRPQDEAYEQPQDCRAFGELLGTFPVVTLSEGDGYRGKLHYNPHHEHAESFLWFCEHAPHVIGFSHDAGGDGEEGADGWLDVVLIDQVESVDIVTRPATTNGLRESHKRKQSSKTMAKKLRVNFREMMDYVPTDEKENLTEQGDLDMDPAAEGFASQIGSLVAAIMTDESLTTDAKRKKLLTALKLMDDEGGSGGSSDAIPESDSEGKDDDEMKESLKGVKNKNVQRLLERLDRYETAEKIAAKRSRLHETATASGLPEDAITDIFLEQLCRAPDADVPRLIEDRRAIFSQRSLHESPRSAGRTGAKSVTLDDFEKDVVGASNSGW